jgi:hypothetical protein
MSNDKYLEPSPGTTMTKALFICKQADTTSNPHYQYFRKFSGLFNSARFVSQMLDSQPGIRSRVAIALDNNCIDRLVSEYRPDIVFIEALWVVPEKFEVLKALHPTIKWVVRLHSQLPFLAGEGMAIDWCLRYVNEYGISVAPNTPELTAELKYLVSSQGGDSSLIEYLPNYYNANSRQVVEAIEAAATRDCSEGDTINIACFGAIRPLKNQLAQALAAMKFADEIGATLNFHINGNRKNIRALFEHSHHTLVEHNWQNHGSFLKLAATMDLGMQVSYSESYNIVMADMVSVNVPVVTSDSIKLVHPLFHADPNSTDSIMCGLRKAWYGSYVGLQGLNRRRLIRQSKAAERTWVKYLVRVLPDGK